MDLGFAYRSIAQSKRGNTLSLAPSPCAIRPVEKASEIHAPTRCDCLHASYLAENLELRLPGWFSPYHLTKPAPSYHFTSLYRLHLLSAHRDLLSFVHLFRAFATNRHNSIVRIVHHCRKPRPPPLPHGALRYAPKPIVPNSRLSNCLLTVSRIECHRRKAPPCVVKLTMEGVEVLVPQFAGLEEFAIELRVVSDKKRDDLRRRPYFLAARQSLNHARSSLEVQCTSGLFRDLRRRCVRRILDALIQHQPLNRQITVSSENVADPVRAIYPAGDLRR